MKATYRNVFFVDGEEIDGEKIEVVLPFGKATARALVVRRRDGAILGSLHRIGGRYALPGGHMASGESSADAIERELVEEAITLIEPDAGWRTRVAVDYFSGYQELSIWHIVVVADAEIGECEELIETRWVLQEEEVWYPHMRELILLTLQRHVPELAHVNVGVLGQPRPR